MTKMTANKKLLAMTIMAISVIQMPQLALMPAIERMAHIFSSHSLPEVQTAVSLPNLISMFAAILGSVLITKGILSKKQAVISGLGMAILTGIAAIFLHTQFWHLLVFSVLLGTAMGFFIPTTMSIMIDSFNDDERQKLAGYQTSFTNIGGIVMSGIGGFLATFIWYGGYLAFLLMVPVAILAFVALPKLPKAEAAQKTGTATKKKTTLPVEVFYYAVLIFAYMLISQVCGGNLSTHLATNNIGNAGTAGLASAIQMAGGVASGLVFNKLSSKFRDYVIVLAFLAVFVGFTIINLGHASLAAVFVGVFIVGSSLSMIIPQCLFSVSKSLDASNSSAATTIVGCFAPGAGAFLSPVIFTNLTSMMGTDSTSFRFQFVAFVALAAAVAVVLCTVRNEKNDTGALPAGE